MAECGNQKPVMPGGWAPWCSKPAGHASDVHESADFAWQDDSDLAWLKCGERILGEFCYEPRDHEDDHQSDSFVWSTLPIQVGPTPFRRRASDLDK